ncbi:MAG: CAP domain-containing protein [Flavobacterium sp.]
MKKTLLKIVLLALVSISIVSCSKDEVASTPVVDAAQVNAKYDYTADETQTMQLINDYRISKGLNKLEIIDYISFKSEEHDQYMISTGAMNHNFFQDRAQSLIQALGATNVSENLAYNYSTPQSVLTAWLNSAGHKENIEGDFSHFGISIRVNAEGKKYYTNMFIKK